MDRGLTSFLEATTERAWYNRTMSNSSQDGEMSAKVVRGGQDEPTGNEWVDASPEERIEAVWTLTRICFEWNGNSSLEPRLQRTVTRLQRAQR